MSPLSTQWSRSAIIKTHYFDWRLFVLFRSCWSFQPTFPSLPSSHLCSNTISLFPMSLTCHSFLSALMWTNLSVPFSSGDFNERPGRHMTGTRKRKTEGRKEEKHWCLDILFKWFRGEVSASCSSSVYSGLRISGLEQLWTHKVKVPELTNFRMNSRIGKSPCLVRAYFMSEIIVRMVGEQRPCEVGGEAEQTYLLCRVCILLWSFLLLMIIALDWAMGFIINFTDGKAGYWAIKCLTNHAY